VSFDDEGNLLDEKAKDPMEVAMLKKFHIHATSLKI
jgi:hypothetical protein